MIFDLEKCLRDAWRETTTDANSYFVRRRKRPTELTGDTPSRGGSPTWLNLIPAELASLAVSSKLLRGSETFRSTLSRNWPGYDFALQFLLVQINKNKNWFLIGGYGVIDVLFSGF